MDPRNSAPKVARDNINTDIAGSSIQDGILVRAVKVDNNRSNLGWNVHTLGSDSESKILSTHLDYDRSKHLPSTSQSYRETSSSGTRLGKSSSSQTSRNENTNPAAPYADRAATTTRSQGTPQLPIAVKHKPDTKGKPKAAPDQRSKAPFYGGFEAAQRKAAEYQASSKEILPPHLRTPSSVTFFQVASPVMLPAGNSMRADAAPISTITSTSNLATPDPTEKQNIAQPTPKDRRECPPITENSEPSISMNAGTAAKSAKYDSPFPCSYADCGMGFTSARRLKKHKEKAHEWCSVCDVDCEDDIALIEHRKASTLAGEGKHISCLKCGDDFGCEAGRDRHSRQAHREVQDVACPGCGETFDRGAGLLAHVNSNKCKDRSGLINSIILSKGRIDAALEMERLAAMGSVVGLATQRGSVDDSATSGGGVSLIDKHDEAPASKEDNGDYNDGDDESVARSGNASSDGGTEIGTAKGDDLPQLAESSKGKGRETLGPTIDGLDRLHLDSHKAGSKTAWSKTLFPDAKPTPIQGGWIQPQQSYNRGGRGPASLIGPSMAGHTARSDWDHYPFDRDAMGRFKCPFQRCVFTFHNEATLKDHLVSGYHQGTTHRCVKCLRLFKTDHALMQHMESPSEKCNVRDSQQFGHLLHVISGGFIDINNDEKGPRLQDGQIRMRASTKEELARAHAIREEARLERERQIAAQW